MPSYRPPYVGLQYSEALTDAYVHTPSDDPVLVTLELHHTDWATPVRVVNDWTALLATLEADAPNDPGAEVEFSGIPFTFSRPAETDSGAPSAVTITVDNLSQIITQMIMDVQESEEPIQVYIRTYLRTDTSAPHELPVVKMWVQSPVQITSSAAQLSCSFGDLTNRRFPKLLWRRGRPSVWSASYYTVIFPTDIPGEFATIAEALSATSGTSTVLGSFAGVYLPGTDYVSYKTSSNPVLNCFSGGAVIDLDDDYVDYYYSTVSPSVISDYSGGGTVACTFLGSTVASPDDGASYLDREHDPVLTLSNVDTTPWGPYTLKNTGATSATSAEYPSFRNNCTNYSASGGYFPQAIESPFTIIRGHK